MPSGKDKQTCPQSLSDVYNYQMKSKEIAIKTIQELPDSATWADIEERIHFLAAIDKGLEDIKSGKVVPHEEVKESLKEWLSK